MINNFQLLRSIGRFDAVTAPNLPLSRLTLVNADNGHGKTTLAAILRSLATGDAVPITERRRLAAQQPPQVVINCTGGPPPAIFANGAWNRSLANMVIFDDVFVEENVYSGLAVGSFQRQNLHELILGAQGVALNRQLQQLVAQIEAHNTTLRHRAAPITQAMRGPFNVDEFCDLAVNVNVEQEVQQAQRALAASQEQDAVRTKGLFDPIALTSIDLAAIQNVLGAGLPDVDAAALARVQAHLATAGAGAEEWIADGMRRQAGRPEAESSNCVFCAQDLGGSPVIAHYRTFFSHAYQELKQNISNVMAGLNREHGGNVPAAFERAVRNLAEKRTFWSRFCELPALQIDFDSITHNWQIVREGLSAVIEAKKAAPLDPVTIPPEIIAAIESYEEHCAQIGTLNEQLATENQNINAVKQRAAAANPAALAATLSRLQATRSRHTPQVAALCTAYLAEKAAKAATEGQRDQTRETLEQYRANAFPNYQAAINRYLARFNASFLLDNVAAANTRGGATCNYSVVINNVQVAVAGAAPQPGNHSFRNTLSAGDRNTLALAFFFASLELDPQMADKIVVIDDPVSSLDAHRSLTTVQEIRRLAERVAQVIVLSHSKLFLCNIWEEADPAIRTALHVPRAGNGSVIESWNVDEDCITAHDRRHQLLRTFFVNGGNNEREVAQSIRPSLEAFLRVAFPEHFPPGRLLGQFRGICLQRLNTAQQILNTVDTEELRNLMEYSNRFHHDTNPNWQTEVINAGELTGFVGRTIAFIRRN